MDGMKQLVAISWCNGWKRQYGDSHWFWAIWAPVEKNDAGRLQEWNGVEPLAKGFSISEKEAKQSAWQAVRAHCPDPKGRVVYRVSWAWRVLSHYQEQDKRPLFSRCQVGKAKWLWVVYKDHLSEKPLAQGYTESPEAGKQVAEQVIGTPVKYDGNGLAEHYRNKQACIRRSQRQSQRKEAAAVEYVYHCEPYYDEYDGQESVSITPYRVIKKTKTRIYVEKQARSLKQTGQWWDYEQRSFIIDRQELEKTGSIWSHSRRERYYSSPEVYFAQRRTHQSCAECFTHLGLSANATEEEVKASFRRLARRTHPDSGGDPEEFKALMVWYEQALRIVAPGSGAV